MVCLVSVGCPNWEGEFCFCMLKVKKSLWRVVNKFLFSLLMFAISSCRPNANLKHLLVLIMAANEKEWNFRIPKQIPTFNF